MSFYTSLGMNSEDYIPLTSFNHHAFYKPFILEMSDNWSNGMFYNISLDELMNTVENAIRTGYSVLWATDVSEKHLLQNTVLPLIPSWPGKTWKKLSATVCGKLRILKNM